MSTANTHGSDFGAGPGRRTWIQGTGGGVPPWGPRGEALPPAGEVTVARAGVRVEAVAAVLARLGDHADPAEVAREVWQRYDVEVGVVEVVRIRAMLRERAQPVAASRLTPPEGTRIC